MEIIQNWNAAKLYTMYEATQRLINLISLALAKAFADGKKEGEYFKECSVVLYEERIKNLEARLESGDK